MILFSILNFAVTQETREDEGAGRANPGKERLTISLSADLVDELRNAVVALSGPPHRLTVTRVVENALRAELGRLRNEQAGLTRGEPFPQRESEVTRGRPIS